MSNVYSQNGRGKDIVGPGSANPGDMSQSDISRILPRQLSTGTLRGTQNVGYGSVKIDGSNDRITIGDNNGDSITLGSTSNNVETGAVSQGFGLNITDSNNASISVGINNDGNVQLLFNDSQTNRLLIGKNNSGQEVVWISPTGVDVTTADPNQPNQLIFNSNQNIFKIVKTGTVTIPGTGNQSPFAAGATGLTIAHNLGFAPAFHAYALVPIVPVGGFPPVSVWNQAFPTGGADASGMTYNLQCGTDANNIYFVDFWSNNSNSAPVSSFSVTYYLYASTA